MALGVVSVRACVYSLHFRFKFNRIYLNENKKHKQIQIKSLKTAKRTHFKKKIIRKK